MPIVIDGNNLLHSLPAAERRRDAVRRRALEAVRGEGLDLRVVFDGPPPSGRPAVEHLGRVTVVYAGSASADDVIVGLIPSGRAAAQWVVVTDDRALGGRVRGRGASVRSVAQWCVRRRPPRRRAPSEPRLSSREVAEWEEFFASGGGGEDD